MPDNPGLPDQQSLNKSLPGDIDISSLASDKPLSEGPAIRLGKSARAPVGLEVRPYTWFSKEKALELLEAQPRNVSHVCRTLGVNRRTWQYHLETDPDFAQRVEEIRQASADELESVMLEMGKRKDTYSFNDRIAYLRAHRPELYNPTKRIIVEGYRMTDQERAKRVGAIETVIDAEVTKTYMSYKERREERQRKKMEALGDGAGKSGAPGV